ncbi:MAG: PAS domain-containing protein [Acidobacteriia bacterium]|nr:PAS domain-containing protein [Terriglobia bacterium]
MGRRSEPCGASRPAPAPNPAQDSAGRLLAWFGQLAAQVCEAVRIADIRTGAMVFVSPAYERVWGRSCASLWQNPKAWIEAIHPQDRFQVGAAYERG